MANAPTKTLASEPVVESQKDVETALCELSWMDAKSARVNGELKAEVGRLKQHATQQLVTKRVSFADRAAKLKAAVVGYASKCRDQLLEGMSGKTCKLSHGEVAFKKPAASVGVENDETQKAHVGELKDALINSLKRQRSAGVPSTDLYDVEVKLSKSRAIGLVKQQRVDVDELAEIGLGVTSADEVVDRKSVV